MTITESSDPNTKHARNFILRDHAHNITISVLMQENTYQPGDIEPSLDPCTTMNNADLGTVLAHLGSALFTTPLNRPLS